MIWPPTITLTSLPPPPHSFQPHKPFYCPPDQAPVFSLSMANPFHFLSHFIQMPPCHKSILGQHYLIPSASFSDSILLFNSLSLSCISISTFVYDLTPLRECEPHEGSDCLFDTQLHPILQHLK